ncbi:MAG: tripartite tricarboxylate transporter substrate-binding protein [Candidatus Binatia bacterium]|jgi:tripartite-type tricarboxylate transporter receptor subunit TctC
MKKLIFGLLLLVAPSSDLLAQPSFFEGKSGRVLVGFTPGGSYDLWARLIAQHMSKHIPGNPSFVVQNMTGGGSMVAANYIYNVAKPDGLTFGVVTPGLYIEQLSGRKEVQYDWGKFSWIGSPERTDRIFYIRADTPYKILEDLRKAAEPPKCGATGVGTASYYWPRLLAETFGFKVNIVAGYPGSSDVNLAIEKGEVHCWGGTVQAFFGSEPGRTWAKTGYVRVLTQGGQKRHPQLADVPTVWNLMDKHGASESTRRVAKVLLSPDDLGRPFFGPPGVPADRVKILRDAFAKILNDPDVAAEAQKKGLDPSLVTGGEIESMIKELVGLPPEVTQRMKRLVEQ